MTIYLVRRHDGTFVQYGFNWTENMQEAEVYSSIGPARSRVTRWSRMNRGEPLCKILAFAFEEKDATVMDQTLRTTQLNAAKRRRDAEKKKERNEREKEYLQIQMDSINQRMAALKNS